MTETVAALRQSYLKDAEEQGQKPKFGYFSVPPSASTADTQFPQKIAERDENGKVKVSPRNIFSGITASGVLKKSFFSSMPCHSGLPQAVDPQARGKANKTILLESKASEKEVFRPASLNKTCISATYDYVPEKETRKDAKSYRDENGRVRIEQSNIFTATSHRIDVNNIQKVEHIADPYEVPKLQRGKELKQDIAKRGEAPFKMGSPVKPFFAKNTEIYGGSLNASQSDEAARQKKQAAGAESSHDCEFRPVCKAATGHQALFSFPEWIPNKPVEAVKVVAGKEAAETKDPFKLIRKDRNAKPSPSISCSKTNLMRCLR